MGEQKQDQDWQKGQQGQGQRQNPSPPPGQQNPSQQPLDKGQGSPQSGDKPYSEKEFEKNPGKH